MSDQSIPPSLFRQSPAVTVDQSPGRAPKTKGKVRRPCSSCGATVERYLSLMVSDKIYCNRECATAAKRHGNELFCALCDSSFYRRFGEQDLDTRVRQFCSRPCYMEWRAMRRSPNTYLKIGSAHAHRVIAEQHLGRPLNDMEVVHHIDNDKHNNDPGNLAVFPSQSFHARCHFGEMLAVELDQYRLLTLANGGVVK